MDKPRTEPIIPVLAAVIRDQEGRILLARRKPALSQGGKWEFPGGKLKPGESPEECLIREIREELGIAIQVEHIFAASHFSYPGKNILLIAYLARYIDGQLRLADHQEIRWVRIADMGDFDLSAADVPLARRLQQEE